MWSFRILFVELGLPYNFILFSRSQGGGAPRYKRKLFGWRIWWKFNVLLVKLYFAHVHTYLLTLISFFIMLPSRLKRSLVPQNNEIFLFSPEKINNTHNTILSSSSAGNNRPHDDLENCGNSTQKNLFIGKNRTKVIPILFKLVTLLSYWKFSEIPNKKSLYFFLKELSISISTLA